MSVKNSSTGATCLQATSLRFVKTEESRNLSKCWLRLYAMKIDGLRSDNSMVCLWKILNSRMLPWLIDVPWIYVSRECIAVALQNRVQYLRIFWACTVRSMVRKLSLELEVYRDDCTM